MDSKTFWHLVEQKKLELLANHARRKKLYEETNDIDAFEGQPADDRGGLFTITVEDVLEKNQYGGQVTCSSYRVAAQRIVEKRHRVATAAEIKTDLEQSQAKVRADGDRERDLAARRAGTAKDPTVNVYVDGEKKSPKPEHG